MKRFFSIDNPVMRVLVKLFDVIALSVIWAVFSVPIFTIGAASTALYATVYHHVRLGEGYLWKTFWESFKDNFKRSTLAWLPMLAMILFLIFDIITIRFLIKNGHPLGAIFGVLLVLLLVSAVWAQFLFAYCARFDGTVKDSLRYSFYLLMAHPLRSIGIMLLIFGLAALILVVPGLAILYPAGTVWITSYIIEDVFMKHMSDDDRERTKQELSDHD